jgi:ribose/xylose/arabinose/galactoside ABC-type transport system permease subunit
VSIWQRGWEGVLGLVVVFGVAVILLTAPGAHLVNVLGWAGQLGLVAAGLALSLRTGTPNLAVGSLSALTSGLVAYAGVELGMPFPVAMVLALVFAVVAGLVMGVLTMLLAAPAWAISLGAAVGCEALLAAITDGRTILMPGMSYSALLGFAVFAIISVAGGVLWLRQDVRAGLTKGWPAALAGLAGSSALAALGGVALLMRLGAADAGTQGWPITVFALAAVLLGGTSVYGERGAAAGTVLAVLILAIAQGQLNLMNAPAWLFQLALGAVVLVGLAVSRLLEALRA